MKVKLIIRSVFIAWLGLTVSERDGDDPCHAWVDTSFYGEEIEFTFLVWRLLFKWIMVQMFQFAVLACFTLLYALIGLVLVIRLCAPLVKKRNAKCELRNET
jgi:hypothetical protein